MNLGSKLNVSGPHSFHCISQAPGLPTCGAWVGTASALAQEHFCRMRAAAATVGTGPLGDTYRLLGDIYGLSGDRRQHLQQYSWHQAWRHAECLQASAHGALDLHPHAKQTDSAAQPRLRLTWVQCRLRWRHRLRSCKPQQLGCSFGVRGDRCACATKAGSRLLLWTSLPSYTPACGVQMPPLKQKEQAGRLGF